MTNIVNLDLFKNMMNYVSLDDIEELPYIEIKYRCGNCKGIMMQRIIVEDCEPNSTTIIIDTGARVRCKLPIRCLYCKLTVMPQKMS